MTNANVVAILLSTCALTSANKIDSQPQLQRKFHLRSSNIVDILQDETRDSSYLTRFLGKSGKGMKSSKSSHSVDVYYQLLEQQSRSSSSECTKWETSYVTELQPQYYVWRPSSSNSATVGANGGKSGKEGKGDKGRKLGKSEKTMVKYVEVQKEVKTCVEREHTTDVFDAIGKSGKAGKGGKAYYGKGGKDESLTIVQVPSTVSQELIR